MNLWWGLLMVWAPKMTIRDSITFFLAKGVKQKRLLGGNPTNLSFFFLFCVFHTFIILLWLCFLCFFLRLCQAKPLWLVLGMIVWSCWKRQKLSAHEKNFHFFSVRDFELIVLLLISTQILQTVVIVQNFWSTRSIRSIQIATDWSAVNRFCFCWVGCLFWWNYG